MFLQNTRYKYYISYFLKIWSKSVSQAYIILPQLVKVNKKSKYFIDVGTTGFIEHKDLLPRYRCPALIFDTVFIIPSPKTLLNIGISGFH